MTILHVTFTSEGFTSTTHIPPRGVEHAAVPSIFNMSEDDPGRKEWDRSSLSKLVANIEEEEVVGGGGGGVVVGTTVSIDADADVDAADVASRQSTAFSDDGDCRSRPRPGCVATCVLHSSSGTNGSYILIIQVFGILS